MRAAPVLVLLCLSTLSTLRAAAADAPSRTDAIPARAAGEAAPPFMLKVINPQAGEPATFDIRDTVGDDASKPAKLLVMAFFATWCKPCRKELPTLVSLAAKYRDKGLKVVSIAIDREADAIAQLPTIAKENNVVHPMLSDNLNIVARRYLGSDTKLPSVVLVRANGTILTIHQGYGEDVQGSFVGEIERALGIGAPTGKH